MVALAKTTMKNVYIFKFIRIRTFEYIGTRLLQRNESTCTNSGNSSNNFGKTKIGGKSGAVWERMAVAVKYSEKESNNTYLSTIRATHDPAMELKTVEEELKGTIGKALGRQGHKILHAKQLMEKELQRYNDLMKSHSSTENSKIHPDIINSALNYNEYRKQALQARWELTVQRQAAGFIVNNHNYVTEQYPIAAALPVVHDLNNESGSTINEKSAVEKDRKVKFTDQLQWWERVGRWR
jgi:hypothetical protein